MPSGFSSTSARGVSSAAKLPFGLKASMECSESKCEQEYVNDAVCCGENFGCLKNDSKDLCVFRFAKLQIPDPDFCQSQYSTCYYCCFDNKCNNSKACSTHFEDFRQNATLIFIFTLCLFLVAVITFTVFVAIRQIRLNKVKELKSKHRILSNHTITQYKEEDSYDGGSRDEPPESQLIKKSIDRKSQRPSNFYAGNMQPFLSPS